MGMFDWIEVDKRINLPLPQELSGIEIDSFEFQTKSLENAMSVYCIREDGLFLKKGEESTNINFHGIVEFGAYKSLDTVNYSLHYGAKFTDGVLSNIALYGFEEHFHESNKKRNDDFKDRQRSLLKKSVFCYCVQNALVSFINLFGLGFRSLGLGRISSNSFSLTFYRPKFLIFSKDRFMSVGLFVEDIDSGILFTRAFHEDSFCVRFLGFGVSFAKHKLNLFDLLSNLDEYKN
jgi:hypothetical protein